MGKLSNLYYEILFKDGTDAGLKAIENKIKNLNAKLALGIDEKGLVSGIQSALSKKFTIQVDANVNTASISQQIQAAAQSAAEAASKVAKQASQATQKAARSAKSSAKNQPDFLSGAHPLSNKTFTTNGSYAKEAEKYAKELAQAQSALDKVVSRIGVHKSRGVSTSTKLLSDLEAQRAELYNKVQGLKALASLTDKLAKGGTTVSQTNLAQSTSAIAKAEKEQAKIRHAARESDIKAAFAAKDAEIRAEKEKNEAIAKAEKERLRTLAQYEKRVNAATTGYNNVRSATNVKGFGGNGYLAYSRGMQSVMERAIIARNDVAAGRTPALSEQAIASQMRQMQSYFTQYRSAVSGFESVRSQITNARQIAANNPGRVGVNTQIGYLQNYASQLEEARKVFMKAMLGDAAARARLDKGAFSPEWFDRIQSAAQRASVSIGNMTKGMNVTNYASNLRSVADELANVGNRGDRVAEILGGIFSVYAAKEFFNNLVLIGGEFEKQKLALGAMFNSSTRAATLYGQIQALAVESPFTFGELTSYAKQLSAYGLEYKDIYDTTKRLADISAAVGVPMSRIILAYGQVSTAKFLRGQELRQFTEAGIPMVEALANRFTKLKGEMVSASQVFDMISNKEVKFEDVKAVLNEMTNPGGRFYNMQEVLAESLSGKWANFQDSVEIMFSQIETSGNSLLKGIVGTMTKVVYQWRELFKVGTFLLTMYAGLAAKRALNNAINSKSVSINARLIADEHANAEALERETRAYNEQTAAINANSSKRAKNALARNARSLVLRGADSREVYMQGGGATVLGAGVRRQLQKDAALVKRIKTLQTELKTAGSLSQKFTTSMSLGFAQMSLKARMFGLSLKAIGASLSAMFLNPAFLAITAISGAVSSWASNKQEQEEREAHASESKKGFKQMGDDIDNFLKSNNLTGADYAVKGKLRFVTEMDETTLNKTIEDVSSQIENSPIDMSFAIENSKSITDAEERLTFLIEKLEEAKNVADGVAVDGKEGSMAEAADVSAKIQDETNGMFDEPLDTNIKDYLNAISEYEQKLLGIDQQDFERIVNNVNSMVGNMGELSPELKTIKADMDAAWNDRKIKEYANAFHQFQDQLHEEKMQDNGKYNGYNLVDPTGNNLFGDWNIHIAATTLLDDVNTAKKIIENAGVDFLNMSDEGYMALTKYVTDYSQAQSLSAEQTKILLQMLEEQAIASADATWNKNSSEVQYFSDYLLTNYGNLFKDKKITDGFSDSQKDAIRKAINALPEHMANFKAQLLAEIDSINKATMSNPIVISIITKTSMDTSGVPMATDAQGQFDQNVKESGLSKYRPGKDETILAYIDKMKQQATSAGNEVNEYKKIANKTDAIKRQQEVAQKKYTESLQVLDALSPATASAVRTEVAKEQSKKDKSAATAANKAESARDKQERERLKKLKERIQRLKDFKSMYEKFADIYGEINALQKVKDSGLYASLDAPDTLTSRKAINNWVKGKMAEIHTEAKSETAEQRNVGESALKSKIDLETELDKEQLEKDLKNIERAIKLANEKWSRYLTFRDLGLSQRQAVMMTFGDGTSGKGDNNGMSVNQAKAIDYRRQIQDFLSGKNLQGENIETLLDMDKDQLDEHFHGNQQILNELTPLVEAYREAWKEVLKDNDSMYKTMLENAKSYAEKLRDVENTYAKQDYAIQMGVAEYARTGGKSGISPELATRMRAANEAQKATESGKIEMEQLKDSAKYLDFFNAAAALTVTEAEAMAEAIRSDLAGALEQGKISIKEFAEEDKKISDGLSELKKNPKTAISALLKGGLSGLNDWRKSSAEAQMAQAANEYNDAKKAQYEALKSGNTSEAQKQGIIMADAMDKYTKARTNYDDSGAKDKRRSNISEALEKIANSVQGLSSFRDSLSDVITSFGGDTDRSGFQTFSTVVDAASSMADGVQKTFQSVMSGDFVGAAFSAVTSPLNIIAAFNKLHDQKLQKQIELSEDRQKDIQAAANQIQHAIENSIGTEDSKATALEYYQQLGAQYQAMSTQNKNKNSRGYFDLGTSYSRIYNILSGLTSLKGKDAAGILSALGFNSSSAYLKSALGYKDGESLTMSDIYDFITGEWSGNGEQKPTFVWSGGVDPKETSEAITKYAQAMQEWSNANSASAKDRYIAEELLALKKEGFFEAESISSYGAEYLALLEQRRELEGQIADESSKKNTDDEVIQSKREELTSLNEQINEFKESVLKEVLGLDFSDFASQLASNLTSAFEQGEDAAKAFEDTVNSILKTVVQNAIKESVIAPYITKLKEQIEDAYDINDPASIDAIVDLIYSSEDQMMDVIADAKDIFDKVNEKTHGALTDTSSTSTLTGNVKNLSEETGTLLASYLNAIRADVSISRGIWEQLSQENFAKMDVMMESQLKQLSVIAQSNQLIADNTSSNLEAVSAIKDYLGSIITVGSGGKAVRVK